MAFHNTNYTMIPITTGTYTAGMLGDGITASTVHEIFCLTPGSITINALGGGSATFVLTAGQNVKVLVGSCTVVSGTYVGFKTKFDSSGVGRIQFS